jgi:hypothetical protein
MRISKKTPFIVAIGLSLAACTGYGAMDDDMKDNGMNEQGMKKDATMSAQMPFGRNADLSYAGALWSALGNARLVGANSIRTTPYEGTEPHGFMLETLDTTLSVGGHTGAVIVKKNYGPAGISKEAVANDPGRHLSSVTVMYKRETGYDPDNQDWFWVKYAPDGSVERNPKGIALAGRVAKGTDQGCIACHVTAPGNDYVFNSDRHAM